jgi:UPF0755 protein
MLVISNKIISKLRPVLFIIFFVFLIVFSLWFFFYLKKLDQFPLAQVRVTIPEGYTNKDIAERFKRFENFDKDIFFSIAKDKEGYLFPDTYFFTGRETAEEVVAKMEDNFKKRVGEIKPEILVMASLLEKESKLPEEKKIISGILWKRLEVGMPLQVDAELDTYHYKELPPSPISNPGLESIEAAKNPVASEYWYYLHDKKGNIHYAKTFEEHKINKEKYLK